MLDIICHYGVFYPLHAGCSDDRSWIRRDASPAQCSDLRRRYRRSSGAIDLWSTQCWSRDPRGAWAGGRASAAPRPPRSARGPERIRDLREAPAPVIDKRRPAERGTTQALEKPRIALSGARRVRPFTRGVHAYGREARSSGSGTRYTCGHGAPPGTNWKPHHAKLHASSAHPWQRAHRVDESSTPGMRAPSRTR